MNTATLQHTREATRTSLSKKLLVFIALPIIVQIVLTMLLCTLQGSADTRADTTGMALEASATVRLLVCKSLTVVKNVHESLKRDLMVYDNCDAELTQIKIYSEWIKNYSGWKEFGETAKAVNDQTERLATLDKQACLANRIEVHQTGKLKIRPVDLVPAISDIESKLEENLRLLHGQQKDWSANTKNYAATWRNWLFTSILLGMFFNLNALVILGFSFNRDISQRLSEVKANVEQIKRRGRLLPPVTGADEIAQLDRVLHDMALTLNLMEEKERALFEHSYNVICSVDNNLRFLEMNQASMKVLGYGPNEMCGKTVENFVDAQERGRSVTLLQQAMIGGSLGSFELTMIRRDGTVLETLWTTSPTPNRDKIVCVLHDISEREAAKRLRKEMVQTVTTDLRSPLSTLSAVYATLKDSRYSNLNEKGQKFLLTAEANASRMLRLINDLLDIERLEAGLVQLQKSPIRLTMLVDQALDSVMPMANQKQIHLANATPQATFTAEVDPHRIMQVLVNLLSNAIKFSPPGSSVSVALRAKPGIVEIAVADQGRGIPPDSLKDVFNRFQQVQRADATDKGGSGLGLAICKSLVELHGGQLSVESEVDKGSIFRVSIPA